MAIETIEDARAELQAMEADAIADHGDEVEIDPTDLVVSVCWNIEDTELAREFCRTELGYIPLDLERRLGKRDWLE